MWPQALQMTRDECRGILRRLELESYSQVISVFRAQGGLSEAKAKLLEELRGIFHISTERHRAEARRVANDEQLATIAEAISGPNTWQEWSREGRRPYPMLPRVAPQTALALIANNVADETASENQKLPYPAETGETIKEEQQHMETQRPTETVERNNYIVTSDPFKVPEIPSGTGKKNLKRNINDQNQNVSGAGSGKKRAISENSPTKNHQHSAYRQQYPHITANSPQVNNNVSVSTSHEQKTKQQQQAAAAAAAQHQHLQKQRYFHHQQQLTKQKMAKKAAAAAASGGGHKRQATPAKSGRRAQQKLLEQQKQQQATLKQMGEQQTQNIPFSGGAMHIDLTSPHQPIAVNSVLSQQHNDLQFLTYATQNVPPQQILMDEQQQSTAAQTQIHVLSANQPSSVTPLMAASTSSLLPQSSSLSPSTTPQIAASKRDVSKNLNKLQQMQQNQHQPAPVSFPSAANPPIMSSHDIQQSSMGTMLTSQPSATKSSTEKSLISTTPVQKYIVEERQPGISTAPGSIVSMQNAQNPPSANASGSAHLIQVSNANSGQASQIMALPQFSAAATKLRAVNTTLIAPGAKISPTTNKKITTITSPLSPINAGALHELANVASTQSQVLHIVETSQGGSSNPTNSTSFASSLQTPPAVIQIQSNTTGVSGAASTSDVTAPTTPMPAPTSQSKVLTTTILPLVLSGSGNNVVGSSGSSPSITGSTPIIIGSSCSTPGSTTTASTTTTTATTTFIKNLPSTVVLNTNTNTLTPVTVTGTLFSTLGAGATVFRKPQNLIKTSVATVTSTSKSTTSVSGAPHIISNVKLTPMNVNTSNTVVTPLCSANSTFKNVLPTTSGMMRTSVKICQSPNGKVVIHPAGLVDGSKMKLNTSTLSHKLLTSTAANSTTGTSVASGPGGQRIAIQKVQIIPAPLGSPAGTATIQAGATTLATKTTTLTGKSNMIFMPSSASGNVRPVTLSKMGNNILLKSTASGQLTTSPDGNNAPKTNIVVLGQSSSIQATAQNTNPSTSTGSLKDTLNQNKIEMDSSTASFMNEDAPLDILNMPIVMDPGVGGVSSGSGDTVTVLSGANIIESNTTNTSTTPIIVEQSSSTHLPLPSPSTTTQQTVILGATDWEMELDQAITTAAHNNSNATIQYQKSSTSKQKRTISTSSSSNSTSSLSGGGGGTLANRAKRLNNELISIELKSNRPPATSGHMKGMSSSNNSANNIIVVDSFDDVIVEEHEDDLSSSCSTNVEQVVTTTESTVTPRTNEDGDQPKILDMQIYQQHDGSVDGGKSQISIVADSVDKQQLQSEHKQKKVNTNVTTLSQQSARQRHQHMESEVDAGFDETIEIDENTAIEYIEEDGAVATTSSSSLSTVTTTYGSMQSTAKESSSTDLTNITKALSSGASTTTTKLTLNTSNSVATPAMTAATKHNKEQANTTEITVNNSNTQLQQQQQETQANNSGSTQVEP
ncbi:uncharacterized protein isoform X1 [Musca autumnalis]|uniref:uncharacterized protein isoform X1 n=1 Tax=Musca autumnalis TaxID=221902 RepID=UPI003CEFBCAD